MAAPDVFAYYDLNAFLNDWFTYNKRTRRHFTYGRVAKDAGLGRSTFANILAGRRLPSATTLEALAGAMGLDAERRGFLLLLREIPAAGTLADRGRALQRVFDHPRFQQARRFDPDVAEVLSHWSFLAVYELAHRPDFRDDPAWIAPRIDDSETDRVSAADIARVLLLLERTGLLVRSADGRLVADATHAQSMLQSGPSMAAHRSMLELARERLVEVRQDQRLYIGAAITVRESAIPALRSMIWEHVNAWSTLADAEEPAPDDLLCMVQVQLFPLAGAARPGEWGDDGPPPRSQ